MNKKILHPTIAVLVITFIAVLFANYGVTQGSLYLFDIIAGVVLYKMITFRN